MWPSLSRVNASESPEVMLIKQELKVPISNRNGRGYSPGTVRRTAWKDHWHYTVRIVMDGLSFALFTLYFISRGSYPSTASEVNMLTNTHIVDKFAQCSE